MWTSRAFGKPSGIGIRRNINACGGAKFREMGVPLYVHDAPDGPVEDEFYQRAVTDVNDVDFLKRFQGGIRNPYTFRSHGAYGRWPDDDIARLIGGVDLDKALVSYPTPIDLFEDSGVGTFDFCLVGGICG